MANEDLQVTIGADIQDLLKELKRAKKGLAGFETRMSKFSSRMKAMGTGLKSFGKSMSAFVTLPLLAAGGASIKMASDFQESLNKVDVAFKSSSNEVRKFAKTSLTTFGIAEGTALDMAALFGDMATSMGTPVDKAADLSTAMVGLAGDLSSFKNINIDEVTTALNGVFTGETESLKRLGIVMTETNLKQFALSKGMSDNLKVMTQAEKVQLRYAFILEKTKNAQGDFARTSGGSANQMRIFTESMKELSVSFGQLLLPMFTELIKKVNSIVKAFTGLSSKTKAIIVAVVGLVAVLPVVIFLAGSLLTVISALLSPIGLVAIAIAALGVAVFKNFDAIIIKVSEFYNWFVKVYNQSILLRGVISGVGVAFETVWAVAKMSFKNIWAIVKALGNNISNLFTGVGKVIEGALTFKTAKISEGVSQISDTIGKGFDEAGDEISKNSEDAAKEISESFTSALDNTIGGHLEEKTPEQIKAGLSKMTDKVTDFAKGLGEKVAGFFSEGMILSDGGGESGEMPSLVPDADKLTEDEERYQKHIANMKAMMIQFDIAVNDIISNSISGTFGMLGDAIGNALAVGGNVLQAAGNALLAGLGGLLSSMGDQLIKLGTAAVLAGTVVKLFGTISGIGAGIAAIGGGVLLKALGSAAGSAANASSGGYSGDTGSSGNIGANAGNIQGSTNNYGGSSSSNSLQNVVFEIQGTKLVGVLSNTLARNKSLSGTLSIN